MKLTDRDIKLFRFYNDVGKKHAGSKIKYKAGPADARQQVMKRLLLKNNPNGLTLDLGCSDGHYKSIIKNYVGLDISLEYLKKFRVKGQRVWGLAELLPFHNNAFDRIFCSEVLEHLWNRKQTLNECYRVLKINGLLIFSAPFGKNPYRIRRKGGELTKKYKINFTPYIHGHFDLKYTKKLFSDSHFNIKLLTILKYKKKRWFVIAIGEKEGRK